MAVGDSASLNEKLAAYLADRPTLKAKVRECWEKVSHGEEIDVAGLKLLCKQVELSLGLPLSAYGELRDTHNRFDFNGNGTIDFKEAYKCVKRSMVDFLKTNGSYVRPAMPWKTPKEAGFTTVRKIGEGGQGQAMLVTDAKGEEVVLKIYKRGDHNACGLAELMDEAGNMTLLDDCGNIAKCLEIFEDNDNFYMVSALNGGGDWTTIQARAEAEKVVMSEEWYRGLFEQAFRGLEHLHRNAVMHCDIKEPNLMLKDADYAKPSVVIIDLGLSHAYFPHGGELCGTPGYIPPETWESEKWFPTGDIFSLGVVALQLLANSIPSQGPAGRRGIFTTGCYSILDVRGSTKRRAPPYWKAQPQSPELLDWLQKCLEKKPENRFRAPQVLEMPWFSSPLPSQEDAPSPKRNQSKRNQSSARRKSEDSSSFWSCCTMRDD